MDGRRSENGNKGQVKKIDVASKLTGERERETDRQTDKNIRSQNGNRGMFTSVKTTD